MKNVTSGGFWVRNIDHLKRYFLCISLLTIHILLLPSSRLREGDLLLQIMAFFTYPEPYTCHQVAEFVKTFLGPELASAYANDEPKDRGPFQHVQAWQFCNSVSFLWHGE